MFALFNIGEGMLIVFLPHRARAIGLGPGGYGYLVAALTCGELDRGRRACPARLEAAAGAVDPGRPGRGRR